MHCAPPLSVAHRQDTQHTQTHTRALCPFSNVYKYTEYDDEELAHMF